MQDLISLVSGFRAKKSVIFSIMLVSCFSCHPADTQDASKPSVVGGKLASPTPYMAGLVDEGGEYAFCGGSFIDPQTVITAAHCVVGNGKKIKIGAGLLLNFEHKTAPLIPVEAVVIHEFYDDSKIKNDIAIVRLKPYDAASLPAPIEPIRLNENPSFPEEIQNVKLTVTGWGNTSSFGKIYDEPLRTADLDLIPVRRCSMAPGYDDVDQSQICAGDLTNGGIDACNGDSGGPLVAQDESGAKKLVGIVSWGEGCALAGKPGVYTRVSHFNSWIKDTLKSLEPRVQPVATAEIKTILATHCYDGWAETKTIRDGERTLKITTQFAVDGDFLPTKKAETSAPIDGPNAQLNPGVCWAQLGEKLALASVVGYDEGTPGSTANAHIVAWQNEPFAAWKAPAKASQKISLSCPDKDLHLKSFDPSSKDGTIEFRKQKFHLLNEEPLAAHPNDEIHSCSTQGHTLTMIKKVTPEGGSLQIVQIKSDLLGGDLRTFRLGTDSSNSDIEVQFTYESDFMGAFTIKNDSSDDVHTWRLECNAAFALIDEFGTYYPPFMREGKGIHTFVRPSHILGTIPAHSKVRFTYEAVAPLPRDRTISCDLNSVPLRVQML